MESQVEEIKSKIDIVELLGSYISLKKAGKNFKANCPFHEEKTPSFIVSPERQIWHCFGSCHEGGDIIKFLMKWENITFLESLRELAKKAGVKLKTTNFEDHLWKKKEKLMAINSMSAEFFRHILTKTKYGKKALDYLNYRKINKKTSNTFQLGYAPKSWNSLFSFLKTKHFSNDEILEAGLAIKGKAGNYYDRFRGRIMFPLKDARGNIIGFSGRVLEKKETTAKYINTPETPIYHKRETLFGIHLAKEGIRKLDLAIIVEGELDVILPYQNGITNIIGIKGSAVTKEQLTLIKRYSDKVTFALDADSAGEEAIKRGIEEAESLDIETTIVVFDYAKDPDEAVTKDSVKFKKILAKPIPIYDFFIQTLQKKYPSDDAFSKKKIIEEIIPYIARIQNPIVKSYYVKKVAKLFDIDKTSIEQLMFREIRQKRLKSKFSFKKKQEKTVNREISIQKHILSLLFQDQVSTETANKIFVVLEMHDFSIVSYKKLYEIFKNYRKDNPEIFDTNEFVNKMPNELKSMFNELYLYASSGELKSTRDDIEKLTYEIKRFSLKRIIKEILLKKDLSKEYKDKLKEKSNELRKVEKKIVSL